MIECYKYLYSVYNMPVNFLNVDLNFRTRGHSLKLKKSNDSKSIRTTFFTNRCVNSWNSLTEKIVNAPTLNIFKNLLDEHWKEYHYVNNSDWYNRIYV